MTRRANFRWDDPVELPDGRSFANHAEVAFLSSVPWDYYEGQIQAGATPDSITAIPSHFNPCTPVHLRSTPFASLYVACRALNVPSHTLHWLAAQGKLNHPTYLDQVLPYAKVWSELHHRGLIRFPECFLVPQKTYRYRGISRTSLPELCRALNRSFVAVVGWITLGRSISEALDLTAPPSASTVDT